jgi:hypothetical protein
MLVPLVRAQIPHARGVFAARMEKYPPTVKSVTTATKNSPPMIITLIASIPFIVHQGANVLQNEAAV